VKDQIGHLGQIFTLWIAQWFIARWEYQLL
jgi:hypothetical protein